MARVGDLELQIGVRRGSQGEDAALGSPHGRIMTRSMSHFNLAARKRGQPPTPVAKGRPLESQEDYDDTRPVIAAA